MKKVFKSFSVSVRRFLAQYCKPVFRCYYKHLWKPEPGSLAASIDAFSKSRQKLRFIQVGSNDGIQHDTLHKFIIRDRWSGILTEPQPEAYQLLKKLYKGMDIVPLNAAVDAQVKSRILYRISFTRQRWASGLSSFNRSQIEKVIESGYVDERCKKEGVIPPADKKDYIQETEVLCMSFSDIADLPPVRDGIDLLHIDTEGYDYEILKQFDFVRNQPGMVIFEHSHLSSDDYSAAVSMLQSFGYTTTRLSSDTVAMK
ncbi:MAG TPA: FkbM family methyltransferase [Bacteroidales bacterium]|nr:FkbM family methyltransferase [Bacteroidales bacterium]